MLKKYIINSRQDLDAIQGTSEYDEFMNSLKGTMTRKHNVQVYPENYGTSEYDGPDLEPIWEDIEDLTTITSFGFTKEDFI
jgi:hypothetical protein